MINRYLVRGAVGALAVLSIKVSAIYFLLMVILLVTHTKDFIGS
ncbi:hypothetical protein VMF7928_01447 [Vibrio marisflavi CECT 7928]|uniref:Uncharacterized protein n=1 Tax=Vibrio marisflavi CECT 7928 TaxID=634439 RepID=A0ABN8E2E5_9VIBR|nr:hypothetical protein VMF7928_01447 [Vibrio marisflavi CECT 7928]